MAETEPARDEIKSWFGECRHWITMSVKVYPHRKREIEGTPQRPTTKTQFLGSGVNLGGDHALLVHRGQDGTLKKMK